MSVRSRSKYIYYNSFGLETLFPRSHCFPFKIQSIFIFVCQVWRPRTTRDTLKVVWHCVDHVWAGHHRACDVIYHYVTDHEHYQIRYSCIWLKGKLTSSKIHAIKNSFGKIYSSSEEGNNTTGFWWYASQKDVLSVWEHRYSVLLTVTSLPLQPAKRYHGNKRFVLSYLACFSYLCLKGCCY